MAGRPAAPEHLVVGHIAKAHGTKGEVYVWPLTDDPEEVFAPGRSLLLGDTEGGLGEAPESLVVDGCRSFKRGYLVHLEGLEDRTSVEPLTRRYLLAPAAELAEAAEDEWRYHELLGLKVETVDGAVVGTVREVYDTEPAELLEVEGPDRLHLVPLTRRIVKAVELEQGRLVIDPPDGLLEL